MFINMSEKFCSRTQAERRGLLSGVLWILFRLHTWLHILIEYQWLCFYLLFCVHACSVFMCICTWVFACVCLCICVCMYMLCICVFVYMCFCVFVFTCVCLCVCCKYVSLYICLCVLCLHVCTHVCLCIVCLCVCMCVGGGSGSGFWVASSIALHTVLVMESHWTWKLTVTVRLALLWAPHNPPLSSSNRCPWLFSTFMWVWGSTSG